MKFQLVVLCLVAVSAHAQTWPRNLYKATFCYLGGLFSKGLRVKWGIPVIDREYYIDIPQQRSQIILDGWQQIQHSDPFYPSMVMYCLPNDLTICALFDDTGFISGLQVSLSTTRFIDLPYDMETLGFHYWNAPDGNNYWSIAQYFVSPETMKKSPEERMASRRFIGNILQEDAIWFPAFGGGLLKVTTDPAEIESSIFTRQACIPSMGVHHYYNMTVDGDCDKMFPWFLMTNDGRMRATSFVAFGTYPALPKDQRMWFEKPPKQSTKVFIPRGPECLYELAAKGIITMHIYYDKHPLTIGC